jgi:hypothetical protein
MSDDSLKKLQDAIDWAETNYPLPRRSLGAYLRMPIAGMRHRMPTRI